MYLSFFTIGFLAFLCVAQQVPVRSDRVPSTGITPKAPQKRHVIPGLYKRSYGNITWIGAHDSHAVHTADQGKAMGGTQYFNLTVQLDSGIRLIQVQGHRDLNGTDQIRLCHPECTLFDGGSLDDYLLQIKAWLDANPKEFVTLILANVRYLPLQQWAQAFIDTGFDKISYVPPQSVRGNMTLSEWPSVETLVRKGNRAVTFLSNGANETQVPYILSEFDYAFETTWANFHPFPAYGCYAYRPTLKIKWPVADRLSVVHHYLFNRHYGFVYPDAENANMTNSAAISRDTLGEHALRCRGLYERRPNFLLVDFFNEGDVWAVEAGMNGVD